MKVFVTGGAGYIGSHACVELLKNSHEILVYDDFSNGHVEALARVKQITNKDFEFVKGDLRDYQKLTSSLSSFAPDVVLHFAGLKAVGESVKNPILYFDVNVTGTINLMKSMDLIGCNRIVFSSSATVYGEAKYLPFDHLHPLKPTNPYGWTKLMVEKILQNWCMADENRKAICLRYFNPIGAHESGLIGEDPRGIPNNLMPYICQVASGNREYLYIYGNDYCTVDGTGERDYVHVVDLAIAHSNAVEKISSLDKLEILDLGTGSTATVLQLIAAFEAASNKTIKTKFVSRRPGDIAKSWSDPTSSEKKLGMKFERTIKDMCEDTWRWQVNNPLGYHEKN